MFGIPTPEATNRTANTQEDRVDLTALHLLSNRRIGRAADLAFEVALPGVGNLVGLGFSPQVSRSCVLKAVATFAPDGELPNVSKAHPRSPHQHHRTLCPIECDRHRRLLVDRNNWIGNQISECPQHTTVMGELCGIKEPAAPLRKESAGKQSTLHLNRNRYFCFAKPSAF